MKKTIIATCFALSLLSVPVSAISDAQKSAIVDHCAAIQSDLKNLQHIDSRTRVYLGRYYESILTSFITPLNVRLVENTLSNDNLINNQNSFAKTRTNFIIDYIEYQKTLESLVGVDCKTEPERFYRKLTDVRKRRQIVADDATKMHDLMLKQVNLVEKLKEKL